MTHSEDLKQILDRVEKGQQTDEDITVLRHRLLASDRQVISQLGKYNVNIGEGKEIHIGDRIYQQWDEEAIQALVKAIQKVSWRCVACLTENDYTQVESQSTGISLIDKLAKQLTDFSQQSVMRYGLKLAFSPNPNREYFISGGNQVIKRWQTNTWEILQEISVPFSVTDTFDLWFTSVAISPDGQLIAACKAYQINIWRLGTSNALHTFGKTLLSNFLDVFGFDSVAFSPNSKILAANDNQDIKLWDGESGREEAIQKLLEVIQEQSNSIPLLPKELPQEEYIRLKNLLAAGRWREANDLTRTIILKAAKAEKEGWLNDEQIQNFPCQVLQIIDRLWLQYSGGRFGFSVQKRICNEYEKDPQAFGDRVGWHVQEAWISASQVIYTPVNAPEGHLPWGIMQVITMDNAALDAFVYGLRAVTKTVARHDWQKQLLADFMAIGGFFIGDRIDKEEFKRNLEYELSHDEAWWEGKRLEELKVLKLFSLLTACPNL